MYIHLSKDGCADRRARYFLASPGVGRGREREREEEKKWQFPRLPTYLLRSRMVPCTCLCETRKLLIIPSLHFLPTTTMTNGEAGGVNASTSPSLGSRSSRRRRRRSPAKWGPRRLRSRGGACVCRCVFFQLEART